jgi:hypothetical protein
VEVNLPELLIIELNAFENCKEISKLNLPKLISASDGNTGCKKIDLFYKMQ